VSTAQPKGAAGSASDLKVYVDGRLVPAGEATVSVFDSAFNFADGVFEGLRVYRGTVFRLDEHIRRLYESAKALNLNIGLPPEGFKAELVGWLRANDIHDDFHFRPIVTRGLRFPPRLDPRFCKDAPTTVFLGGPIAATEGSGIRAVISSVRRPNPDVFDSKIKSINYGSNLVARIEAIRQGADDAVMLDSAGYLAEATAANIFLIHDGILFTPWPRVCLAGITRAEVMNIGRKMGLDVVERDLTPTELINAEEAFLTGTGAEINPIVEVNGQPVGDGSAGALTLELLERYRALVHAEGVPID
jgi:branched-chain amino acid aminotransferase